jgi:uncharacterized protein with HEPN domain
MVHNWESTDLRVVWDTVLEDLPVLVRELERFLSPGTEHGAAQEQA